jgi:hypothetical protein
MIIDNESPPGAWRDEILKGPATVSQLREIVSELKHALKLAEDENKRLKEQRDTAVSQLAAAVASEMEAKGLNAKLKQEVDNLWNALKLN